MSACAPHCSGCGADTAEPAAKRTGGHLSPEVTAAAAERQSPLLPLNDHCFLPHDIPSLPLLLLPPEQKSLRDFVTRIWAVETFWHASFLGKNGPFSLSLEDPREPSESL